jgi:sodium-dependent dicarboxylate transporter 2/3/5
MSTAKGTVYDSKYIAKLVVFVVLLLGFQFIPPAEPLTVFGMRVLGVFLAMLWGWCTIGLVWPSLAGMFVLIVGGSISLGDFLAAGWGSSVFMLVFFMMMIAKNLEKSGISNFLAMWFISRKIVIGRPWLFVWIFLFAISIISSLTSSTAMILLGWAIFYDIREQIKADKFEAFCNFIMVGIVMAACAGDGMFHFRTVGAVAFGLTQKLANANVNGAMYAIWAFTLAGTLSAVFALCGKFLFRIDASKLKALDEDYFASRRMTLDKRQKALFGLMILLIVMMLWPSLAPAKWIITVALNRLGACGTAMTICLLMTLLTVDGKPLMNPVACVKDGVPFGVMFMIATVFPLALKLMPMKETGINAWLVGIFSPLVQGHSPMVFVIIAALLALLLTNFMGNVVVPTLLYPIFLPIAQELGISPIALMVPMAFASNFGILLPSGCPMGALMFGNTDNIRVKDIYKYAPAWFLICVVVIGFIWTPLATMIF